MQLSVCKHNVTNTAFLGQDSKTPAFDKDSHSKSRSAEMTRLNCALIYWHCRDSSVSMRAQHVTNEWSNWHCPQQSSHRTLCSRGANTCKRESASASNETKQGQEFMSAARKKMFHCARVSASHWPCTTASRRAKRLTIDRPGAYARDRTPNGGEEFVGNKCCQLGYRGMQSTEPTRPSAAKPAASSKELI